MGGTLNQVDLYYVEEVSRVAGLGGQVTSMGIMPRGSDHLRNGGKGYSSQLKGMKG